MSLSRVMKLFYVLIAVFVLAMPIAADVGKISYGKKNNIVTSNVGALKANFLVTQTGQAHYSVPIEVSPGTAKMQPALAITYDSTSSNTRNGVLGMGFSLDGITAITRCSSNKAQNGVIHSVDYSDQDRFCLNGEQLIAIHGNYGADGAEYRTYNDSQAKIIS